MRAFALMTICALVTGCAQHPELFSAAPPAPAPGTKSAELDAILAEASELQTLYGKNYKKAALSEDLSQLPIIAAAAGAAWVLLVDKGNAVKDAAKIAIGAGAYTAGRGQLMSAGMSDAYIAGHGALTCVIGESSRFAGAPAVNAYNAFDQQLQGLADGISAVNSIKNLVPSGTPTDAEKANLAAARTVADSALAQAETVEERGLAQLGAFDNAPSVFRNAISSISVRVASKGRVRPPVEFAALRDSLAAPKTPTQPLAEVASLTPPDTAAEITAALTEKATSLIRATTLVTRGMKDYSGSLARVAACPDKVS